jgi:hypothetical protein
MSKIKEIIGEGFVAGLFFGIGIKTGISPDEAGISVFILKEFCKATEGMAGSFNCGGFVFLMIILSIIVTIISIVTAITKVDDWRIGAVIYGISFLVGMFLIVKS